MGEPTLTQAKRIFVKRGFKFRQEKYKSFIILYWGGIENGGFNIYKGSGTLVTYQRGIDDRNYNVLKEAKELIDSFSLKKSKDITKLKKLVIAHKKVALSFNKNQDDAKLHQRQAVINRKILGWLESHNGEKNSLDLDKAYALAGVAPGDGYWTYDR